MRQGRGRTTAVALSLAILGAITSAAPARAAAAGTPAATTPSVDEIVTRYVEARGGLKIRTVQSIRETGRVTSGAKGEALVVRELKRPNRSRFEITQQGVTGVFASDGTRGWKMSPFDGDMAPTALPPEAVQEAIEQADIEGPLVDWKAKGHQIELAGRETVGAHEAYKIKMTLKSGALRYEYIDIKTFYRVRADSSRTLRGAMTKVTMTFDDYQKTSGLAFPHLVEVETEGRPQKMRVVVDKVEVNPPIDDTRFVQPVIKP
jgi:hypothetical protein